MISRVRGTLLRRQLEAIEVLTAGGVAYQIEIPHTVFERLPREGAEIELRTYQVVREDAVALYGFLDEQERSIFTRLLAASGVGPRLALSMLSTLSPERLVRAITERDTALLRQVPGVGRKTAERLILELADKLDDLAVAAAGPRPEGRGAEEAIGALIALGYSPAAATTAVRRAIDEKGALDGVALIRHALATVGGAT
ncbi:MAG: Holliday junction branch migration protein RuvA [Gemmatimonadetes bacterium]|nr:Holliday junction branch migration protein RuvA [Gemmatimonadota bacterium]